MTRQDFKSAAEWNKWRYHNDPEYRERRKAQAREGMRRHYYESEEYRNRYHNNPGFRESLLGWQSEHHDELVEYSRRSNRQRYCREAIELIENYAEAYDDEFKGWHLHHRFETHFSDGTRRTVDISMDELKSMGMYWNRPADELIWMRGRDHRALHRENIKRRGA